MIPKYYDSDCNLGLLDNKTVAIMGYGRTCTRAASMLLSVFAATAPAGQKQKKPA